MLTSFAQKEEEELTRLNRVLYFHYLKTIAH